MKLSAAVFAVAISTVSAYDFSLRSAVNSVLAVGADNKATNDVTDARVIVAGLDKEMQGQDLDILNDSIVTAFNTAYAKSGKINNVQTLGTSSMLDDSKNEQMVMTRVDATWWWINFSPECRACPPDDDMMTTLVGMGDMHKIFQDSLCESLRKSGSATYTNAKDCTFEVLEKPGQESSIVQPVFAQAEENTAQGQISITGVINELSQSDIDLISTSAVEAYNEAYKGAGLSMKHLYADTELWWWINFSPECRACPPDDDAMMNTAVVLSASIVNNGVSMDQAMLNDKHYAFLTTAFEKALCSKLQNSGSANFANARDCSLSFVNSPVTMAQTSQM